MALERRGKLHALVTQNIDELHQRAGQSPALVVEVHGSMRRVMCWQCGRRAPMDEALARVRAGEDDPHCRDCGGILKSDTISFGQSLVPEVIDRALNAAAEADLLLAVGTTLQVQPVASMVPIAARAGAAIVIVNDQPTAMDALADVVVREPIGGVLTAICGAGDGLRSRQARRLAKSRAARAAAIFVASVSLRATSGVPRVETASISAKIRGSPTTERD